MAVFIWQMQIVNLTRAGKIVIPERTFERSYVFSILTILVANDIMFTI